MPASWKTTSSTGSTARARPSRKNPENPSLSRSPPGLCWRAQICPDRAPYYRYGNDGGESDDEYPLQEIGRAHVCTPVTNAHLVCRLLLEKKKTKNTRTIITIK